MQLRAFKFSYTHTDTKRYKPMTSNLAQKGIKPIWKFVLSLALLEYLQFM